MFLLLFRFLKCLLKKSLNKNLYIGIKSKQVKQLEQLRTPEVWNISRIFLPRLNSVLFISENLTSFFLERLWVTNSVDFLQRICPLPGSKGLTVSRVLFWGCANQLGNICCPSGKVTGVTVSGLDVHSDPPSSFFCYRPLHPPPPSGGHRPCRHNHHRATIFS